MTKEEMLIKQFKEQMEPLLRNFVQHHIGVVVAFHHVADQGTDLECGTFDVLGNLETRLEMVQYLLEAVHTLVTQEREEQYGDESKEDDGSEEDDGSSSGG